MGILQRISFTSLLSYLKKGAYAPSVVCPKRFFTL